MTPAELERLEARAPWFVYGLLALSGANYFIFMYDQVLVAYGVSWGLSLTLILLIRRIEAASHIDQRGWWTMWVILTGGWGLLGWLRHLSREHPRHREHPTAL